MFEDSARQLFRGAFSLIALLLAACGNATPEKDITPSPKLVFTPYLTATSPIEDEGKNGTAQADDVLLPTPTPLTYIVVAGDTMLAIAERYGVSLDALLAANLGIDPRFLSVGMDIIVPAGQEAQSEGFATPTPVPLQVAEPICYETAVGELWCFINVQNQQGKSIENLSALISLFSPSGEFLESSPAISPLNVLAPDAALVLVAYWANPPEEWVSARGQLLSAYSFASSEERFLEADLSNVELTLAPSGRSALARGELKLQSGKVASSIWVVAIAYDAEDNVVGQRRWEGDGSDLEFEFWVYSLGAAIERVDLLVEARP